ncbi:MAG: hypothetical protein HOP16_01955 [Acidobacteria bacterium]|nr:hypothetical protein [Acidobacteriota bacterium]
MPIDLLAPLTSDATLNAIANHLRDAVTRSTLVTDPGPHMVVPDLLPPEIYAHLLETMPPAETFDVADKVKANFDPEATMAAPARSREAWTWFHSDVVDRQLVPVLTAAFRQHLLVAYGELFGRDQAEAALGLPHHAFQGRLMLRRPGYRLKPHRDKKSASLTGLVYFARPGDSRDYGTELFRVLDDQQATVRKTYYPDDHGARTELARSVPFVGNSALIFMNVPGMAHGAGIPPDATQLERYAYQFYVGPPKADVRQLSRRMPAEPGKRDGGVSDDEY